MTGSAFLLGVVGFAGQIPTFLLSPVTGVLTDRWLKYRILLVPQIFSMIQAINLAWLCLADGWLVKVIGTPGTTLTGV